MKLFALCGLIFTLVTHGYSQARPLGDLGVMRIYVKHGDPWMIKALLEGTPITQPELSTILGFAGIPDKDSALIESLFGGKGRLVVNPTDNSILFIPDKK